MPKLRAVEKKKIPILQTDKFIEKVIPMAEWMDTPAAWDKKLFVKEISNYLKEHYGIIEKENKHSIAMLADHMDTYVKCNEALAVEGLIVSFNNEKTLGPNPHISIRNSTIKIIVELMKEMGLTPKSKLVSNKKEELNSVNKFLAGPLA